MTQQQPQQPDELTPEEAKEIAKQIEAFHAGDPHRDWSIHGLMHLYDLPTEAYEVFYKDGYSLIFFRDDDGELRPANYRIYYAPNFTTIVQPMETRAE